jgi:hypothetical protein
VRTTSAVTFAPHPGAPVCTFAVARDQHVINDTASPGFASSSGL